MEQAWSICDEVGAEYVGLGSTLVTWDVVGTDVMVGSTSDGVNGVHGMGWEQSRLYEHGIL